MSIQCCGVQLAFFGIAHVLISPVVAHLRTNFIESGSDYQSSLKFEAQMKFPQNFESRAQWSEEWDSILWGLNAVSLELLKKCRDWEGVDTKIVHFNESQLASDITWRIGPASQSYDGILSFREEKIKSVFIVIKLFICEVSVNCFLQNLFPCIVRSLTHLCKRRNLS